MLRIWNVSLVLATGVLAILGTFLVRSGVLNSIHAFGASTLGVPFLLLIAFDDRRLDRAGREPRGLAALRAPAGLAALARGGLPAQQPAAGRALLRGLLGHVLPADRRGRDRPPAQHRPAGLRGVRRPAGAAARARRRRRAGDRVAARDRREPAPQPRAARGCRAGRARGADRARPDALGHRADHVHAGRLRRSAASRRSSGAACAPGARSSREPVPKALVSLVRRNRRRYGGYLVHLGIITLFVGVAASSSFKDVQDVSLEPGPDRARSAATSSPTSSRSPSCTRRPTGGWSGSRSARS